LKIEKQNKQIEQENSIHEIQSTSNEEKTKSINENYFQQDE
jgi:hypothetical protein